MEQPKLFYNPEGVEMTEKTPHKLVLTDRVIDFTLERRTARRKTISIYIDKTGAVLVRTPAGVSVRAARDFVERKADWIERKTSEARGNLIERAFVSGESIDWLGRTIPLVLENAALSRVSRAVFKDGALIVRVPPALAGEERSAWIKRALRLWYLPRADTRLRSLAAGLADETGLKPRTVRVKNLKSSWGICRGDDISLNWRLIMAKPDLAEYVIYHELCHLKHKGHSRVFWSAVGSFVPDYRRRRQELKKLDFDWI
jgi:predicted metal-dependent hydrolase